MKDTYLVYCHFMMFILDTPWGGSIGWTGPRPDLYIDMEDISMYQDTTTVTLQDDMVIHLISTSINKTTLKNKKGHFRGVVHS